MNQERADVNHHQPCTRVDIAELAKTIGNEFRGEFIVLPHHLVNFDQGDPVDVGIGAGGINDDDVSSNSEDCVYAYRGDQVELNPIAVDGDNAVGHAEEGDDDEETDFLEMDFDPEPNSEQENMYRRGGEEEFPRVPVEIEPVDRRGENEEKNSLPSCSNTSPKREVQVDVDHAGEVINPLEGNRNDKDVRSPEIVENPENEENFDNSSVDYCDQVELIDDSSSDENDDIIDINADFDGFPTDDYEDDNYDDEPEDDEEEVVMVHPLNNNNNKITGTKPKVKQVDNKTTIAAPVLNNSNNNINNNKSTKTIPHVPVDVVVVGPSTSNTSTCSNDPEGYQTSSTTTTTTTTTNATKEVSCMECSQMELSTCTTSSTTSPSSSTPNKSSRMGSATTTHCKKHCKKLRNNEPISTASPTTDTNSQIQICPNVILDEESICNSFVS